MKYTLIQIRPKEAELKLTALAQQGWKVVSQSETPHLIKKCFGLSKEVDAIINVILVKEA